MQDCFSSNPTSVTFTRKLKLLQVVLSLCRVYCATIYPSKSILNFYLTLYTSISQHFVHAFYSPAKSLSPTLFNTSNMTKSKQRPPRCCSRSLLFSVKIQALSEYGRSLDKDWLGIQGLQWCVASGARLLFRTKTLTHAISDP